MPLQTFYHIHSPGVLPQNSFPTHQSSLMSVQILRVALRQFFLSPRSAPDIFFLSDYKEAHLHFDGMSPLRCSKSHNCTSPLKVFHIQKSDASFSSQMYPHSLCLLCY